LAKAALVASAKAVLRTSAAQSTIFLVVNTCLFLDQFAVFAAHWNAHAKWLNRYVEADRQNCGLFPSGLSKAK